MGQEKKMKKNEFPKWVEVDNHDLFGPPTVWVKVGRWSCFEGVVLKATLLFLAFSACCLVWNHQATKRELRPLVVEAPVTTVRLVGAANRGDGVLWEVKLENDRVFVVKRSHTKEAPSFVVK
jgi:hypothetical protein